MVGSGPIDENEPLDRVPISMESEPLADYDDSAPFTGEYLDFAELSRDELQGKLLELLTLVETSRELLRAKDADDMARRVLLSAIGVLGASSACVLRRDAVTGGVHVFQQFGLEVDNGPLFTISHNLAQAFLTAGPPRPFRVDEEPRPGPHAALLQDANDVLRELDVAVVYPLTGREGLMGLLGLGRRLLAEGYAARDLDLFASLAELYGMALERAARPMPAAARAAADFTLTTSPSQVHRDLVELRQKHPPLRTILGESAAMLSLFADLVEFADSRATILIQGESGTGKELIAKAIHALSRRQTSPFEVVDCSSIPKELIESELFGHVRGAFTGAVRDRRGAFPLAHEGTRFLDEIGDMTLASQTRLLRVLQEGKFRPVGGEKTHSVDVRVVAATNVDLRAAVTQGSFRKDLFYRIQVFPLRLPPLRERAGDVAVLTRKFLRRFYADEGRPEPVIEDEVLRRLEGHSFPGNVRELQNMVEALAIRSRGDGVVQVRHLKEVFRSQRIAGDPTDIPTQPTAGTGPPSPARATENLSIGAGVRRAWRASGFNLLETSRQLRARRLDGDRVPVVDRVQLSHYLDGEILQTFRSTQNVRDTIEQMAGGERHAHRAAKRVRRVLDELWRAAQANAVDAFPRLPEEYREDLDALLSQGTQWLQSRLQSEASRSN